MIEKISPISAIWQIFKAAIGYMVILSIIKHIARGAVRNIRRYAVRRFENTEIIPVNIGCSAKQNKRKLGILACVYQTCIFLPACFAEFIRCARIAVSVVLNGTAAGTYNFKHINIGGIAVCPKAERIVGELFKA